MDFEEYQEKAASTDQFAKKTGDDGLMIPLLGIAGEVGTLVSEFKKKVRDREKYQQFEFRAQEELGDILWYLANTATHLGLSLDKIAATNLLKTQERWPIDGAPGKELEFLDSEYPESEQLPREMTLRVVSDDSMKRVQLFVLPSNERLGDELSDNAYEDDGYRYHDVVHLAHWAVLGWSPVVRKLLRKKRKSIASVDEVEDGARAGILEELIVAYVYDNAAAHSYYDGVKHVDTEMLYAIKRLVSRLEVGRRSPREWEDAILQGYNVFRYLVSKKEAVVKVDMKARRFQVVS